MMPGNTRDELNYGGKIIMPPSSLNKLTRLHISYPMLFELQSEETGMTTHGGVLEFIAQEGLIYLPQWMMEALAASPGSFIKVTNTSLQLGTFVKIEPQSVDFLDISDPKAVLENALRNYSTLTKDDVIQISYNDKIYSIKVLEVKPDESSHSISVVETDLEVDFAPPVGYVEPQPDSRPGSVVSSGSKGSSFNGTGTSGSSTPARSNTPTPLGQMAKNIKYEDMLRKEMAKRKVNSFQGGGHKLSTGGRSLGGTKNSTISNGNDSTSSNHNFNNNNSNDTQPPVVDRKGKGIPLTSRQKQKEEEQKLHEEELRREEEEISQRILTELPSTDAGALTLPFGQLFFGYPVIPLKNLDVEAQLEYDGQGPSGTGLDGSSNSANHRSVTFSGAGQSLRKSRKRKGQQAHETGVTSPTKKASPTPSNDIIEID